MNIVVLTNNGSLFGKKLLRLLIENGLPVHGVITIHQPLNTYWRLFSSVTRRVGLADALYFSIKRFFHAGDPLASDGIPPLQYPQVPAPFFPTDGTNTPHTLKLLRDLNPDILLLGQCGIVRQDVLSIPTRGTLNAHPGILPLYRGIDCARWAIYNDALDGIGASLHWVCRGVDLGDIIAREVYAFHGDETLALLDRRLDDLALRLMVKNLKALQSGEKISGMPQEKNSGRQYYKMPRTAEKISEQKLQDFLKQKENACESH